MADDESLFSLEVIVENLDNIYVSCRKPAVAFRLLDFPTVVIRSEREFHANELSYEIQSGKSCLFKMSADILRDRLRDTPLYIMLVDASFTNTKLLASTTISLVSSFQNIRANTENNGFDMPAVSGDKGEYEMYNLMGSCVATVKLAFRMFSFGVGITGHVKQSLSKQIKRKKKESIPTEPQTLSEEATNIGDIRASPEQNEHIASDNEIPVQPNIVQHTHIMLADADTQTNISIGQNMKLHEKLNTPELLSIQHHNITRPPPLYYNSISAFTKLPVVLKSSERQIKNPSDESTAARVVPTSSGKLVKHPKDEMHFRPGYIDASVQTSESHQGNASTQCSHDKKLSLPLIEALLDELSLVRTKYVNDSLPEQNHEQCTPPNKSKQVRIHEKDHVILNYPQDQKIPKTQKSGRKEKPSHPVFRKGAIVSKPVMPIKKGVLISRHPVKFKKSSLKYGTTRTQKLREAMNKKNFKLVEKEIGEPNVAAGKLLPEHGSKQDENDSYAKHFEQKAEQISRENNPTMMQKSELEYQDFGIQVKMSDDNFSSTEQKCLSKGMLFDGIDNGVSNDIGLGATYKYDAIRDASATPTSNQIEDAYKLFSDEDRGKVPNVSDLVSIATNRKYTYKERYDNGLQERALSSDGGFSEKSLNMGDGPGGQIYVNPEGSTKESGSSGRRISDGSLASVNKPGGNVPSNDEGSSKESPGRSSLCSRLSLESLGLSISQLARF
ncbi:microtubule-associated protein 10-like [Dendronephthya gigantea]|uniref:microtubule-associated protein 10-like n=1 Tax=Dendronephthya gigantea TaxID=151771 RepID=UPI00106AA4AB|nr:microtubule-associated protein 10-like [Dendronephthya gigantea]